MPDFDPEMTTFAAFLRGINVGGTGKILMEDLRKIVEKAGAKAVRTHIQSGNVVFQAKNGEIAGIRGKIGQELKKSLGWEPKVMYRTAEELNRLVKAPTFVELASKAEIKWYIVFLEKRTKAKMKLPLKLEAQALEVHGMVGLDLLVISREKKDGRFGYPNGWAEKALGMAATSRNWNTVVKMAALAGDGKGVA